MCLVRFQSPGSKHYCHIRKIISRRDQHPTVTPVALVSHFIKLYTREGDIVLDPFIGSRVTGVAHLHLNCNFIGMGFQDGTETDSGGDGRMKPSGSQKDLTLPATQARIAAGLSVREAARRARISMAYLRRVERYGAPYALARRLAALYCCSITVFLPPILIMKGGQQDTI